MEDLAGVLEALDGGVVTGEEELIERELRKVVALEVLAQAAKDIAFTMQMRHELDARRFERQYPARREVQDATVTHSQTEEERLRESQGATGESDQEWVGQRERKWQARKSVRA